MSLELFRILGSPWILQTPACFDALSAKLVEKAGFQCVFATGFSISAARLGLPDEGLISYGEMVEQGRLITQAVSIPVIGDADTGYGNAINVKRTVKGYIKAGFAGIMLGDHVSPKACGEKQGKRVVSREEAVMRIRAANDARRESGSNIIIVARTDSRQAVSFEESLWRTRAFADAGADVIFVDALTSKEEMKQFCLTNPLVPKLANMLEGMDQISLLNPSELEDIGYKLVLYPLSLLGVSIRAMQDALLAIKGGHIPPPGCMPSFEEIKDILGFNTYYEEEKLYATSSQPSSQKASNGVYGVKQWARDKAAQRAPTSESPNIEPKTEFDVYLFDTNGSSGPFPGIWSQTLLLRITGKDGVEHIHEKFPAGMLEGIESLIPGLGGFDIKAMLDNATNQVGGKLLVDEEDLVGDRIQIFLE